MAEILNPAPERLLVCVSPSPSSANLINSAGKIAGSLNAEWSAVYVEDPGMVILPEAAHQRVADNLRLAEQLGGETFTLRGRNIAREIVDFARQRHITRIIVGKPQHSIWTGSLRRSPVDQLVRISGEIEVCVVSGEPAEEMEKAYVIRPGKIRWSDYGAGILYFLVVNVLCYLMYPYFELSNLIMVYLLGVMVTAIECGRGPGILVSLLSVLAFDILFVPPRFSFAVSDAQYLVTFAVMLVVALAISHLTAVMRQQAEVARLQERQAAAMHSLSRQLAGSRGIGNILDVGVRHISQIFDCRTVALLPEDNGKLKPSAGDVSTVFQENIIEELNIARSAYRAGQTTGIGTRTSPSAEILCVPLLAADSTLGILALRPGEPERFLLPEQLQLLESLVKQVALALEVEYLSTGGIPCRA